MTMSKCPECYNNSFKLMENSPQDSVYKSVFIQCESCGCIVGSLGYYDNIGMHTRNFAGAVIGPEYRLPFYEI